MLRLIPVNSVTTTHYAKGKNMNKMAYMYSLSILLTHLSCKASLIIYGRGKFSSADPAKSTPETFAFMFSFSLSFTQRSTKVITNSYWSTKLTVNLLTNPGLLYINNGRSIILLQYIKVMESLLLYMFFFYSGFILVGY